MMVLLESALGHFRDETAIKKIIPSRTVSITLQLERKNIEILQPMIT
jgi:hypothetical protein